MILIINKNLRWNKSKLFYVLFSGDLKQFIWCKTTVPPCQQKLYGWKKEFANMTPNTVLQTLDLPRENTLYLQSSLPQDGDLANEA